MIIKKKEEKKELCRECHNPDCQKPDTEKDPKPALIEKIKGWNYAGDSALIYSIKEALNYITDKSNEQTRAINWLLNREK